MGDEDRSMIAIYVDHVAERFREGSDCDCAGETINPATDIVLKEIVHLEGVGYEAVVDAVER
jgi:hypothetical protein